MSFCPIKFLITITNIIPLPLFTGTSDWFQPSSQDVEKGHTSHIDIQPQINTALQQQSRDAYRRLVVTAYLLAVSGQPLTSFKTLVQVQKANGVKLIQGTDDSKKAAEFVSVIADVIRNKITNIVTNATAFSILSDGSQARKTGSKKN